jgi:hypothetical protein
MRSEFPDTPNPVTKVKEPEGKVSVLAMAGRADIKRRMQNQ